MLMRHRQPQALVLLQPGQANHPIVRAASHTAGSRSFLGIIPGNSIITYTGVKVPDGLSICVKYPQ